MGAPERELGERLKQTGVESYRLKCGDGLATLLFGILPGCMRRKWQAAERNGTAWPLLAGADMPMRAGVLSCPDRVTGYQGLRYATMRWSIAPKMLNPAWSFISIRMRSPKLMNEVLGLPILMVSIILSSAIQE